LLFNKTVGTPYADNGSHACCPFAFAIIVVNDD